MREETLTSFFSFVVFQNGEVYYHGMRLTAIDGTDIALENSAKLKETFGCSGPKRDATTALGSLAAYRLLKRSTLLKNLFCLKLAVMIALYLL